MRNTLNPRNLHYPRPLETGKDLRTVIGTASKANTAASEIEEPILAIIEAAVP
jgi:hypothetical protein